MKSKDIGLYAVAALLFFGLGAILSAPKNKLDDEITKMSKVIDKSGKSPEVFLMKDDARYSYQHPVEDYDKALQALDKQCIQNRSELAVMAFLLAGKERKAGFKASNLSSLDGLSYFAAAQKKRGADCLEAYLAHSKSIKESAQSVKDK